MFERLSSVAARFQEIEDLLMDPGVTANHLRMRELTIEHSEIAPIVENFRSYRSEQQELSELDELMSDPEMRDMAIEERARLNKSMSNREQELRLLLLPKDPYEGRNILLEIRAGTGGDEAAIFAADLFRMYSRYASNNGWKLELLSQSETTIGGGGGKSAIGYKEIICLITSAGAYAHLKYESGVHRVQRVPLTETQGRVHTSAATVAILPEPEAVEININPQDLRIDVFRASGPGGQSVNTTDSAVRIVHVPTNLVVICQDEKSQHKNKAKALKVLSARLFDKIEGERHAAEAEDRKSQVGTGDRSERIRTYNYPQNRVTDHRAGCTLYKLDSIITGNLDHILDPVRAHFQAELLAEMDKE
jgi:peptide chain release factor 1